MKSILITGSTSGIGKIAATELAKKGHNIFIHGRNRDKVEATVSEIKLLTKNDQITGFVADLSDLSAIKGLGKEINAATDNLDVLINNAGILNSPVELTNDGFDIRFAVNYLAPIILTDALLPLLKKTNHARIINLSSAAQSTVSHPALAGKMALADKESYAQSKLALTMWSFDLAKQEKDLNVIAVNPGSLLNTKMVQEAYGKFWSPAEKGSSILEDLALSSEYDQVSGKYFDNDKGEEKGYFSEAHPDAYAENKIQELMDFTRSLLK